MQAQVAQLRLTHIAKSVRLLSRLIGSKAHRLS
jgi:hypothetical protein